MDSLLRELNDEYRHIALATSKPTVYSAKILEHFGISDYFDLIIGSNLDGARSDKREIIRHILDTFSEFAPSAFVMVGDRKYDISGATSCGIDSIGVTYGYGSPAEIEASNPTLTVNSVYELKDVLLKG